MKKYVAFFWLTTTALVYAQADTEIYLFDLTNTTSSITLTNPKNISNNEGYDNQPSFTDDDTIIFSSTRDNQTDILKFHITQGGAKTWITDTPTGSEYSPLKIPDKNEIAAIRLDLDGLQRLYRYDISTGLAKEIITDLKIGYHVWVNDQELVCTVLKENRMDLMLVDLKDASFKTVATDVGRSLHHIPGSDAISYINKTKDQWSIDSLNMTSLNTFKVANTYNNNEDICWLGPEILITGTGKGLAIQNVKENSGWEQVIFFEQEEIHHISRIAINKSGTRLAFVSEVSPRTIVQQQLDAYNARNIDGFLDAFSENVELYTYPEHLRGTGKGYLRKQYESFFETTPDLHCELKNRIVEGNTVIDHELVTANGKSFTAVAIYEVENGKIAKVTFIR